MIRDASTLKVLKESIQRFVKERLVPFENYLEERDELPPEIVSEMKELGLFGLSIPEEFGGLGLTCEEEVIVAFELGKTSPAFRSIFGTNNGIGSQGIIIDGTDAQKSKYLPKLAAGDCISAFCLTEPGSGSDSASLRTSARRDGDFYLLNGLKRYVTNGPEADLYTVMARTSTTEKGSAAISAFVVEASSAGVTRGKTDKKMGQKGSHTCDVIFDDCRVHASNLIGETEGIGFKTAMKVLDKGRLHISAVCVGVAERMLTDAVRYASERQQFGKPISDFQLIQAMIADSKTEIYAAQSMILETARKKDVGESVSTQASCCKLFASEMCGRVADRAVQIHGGAGYMSEYSIERFYRDVRLFRIYEGTSQIQQLIIAKSVVQTGNQPFH